MQTCLRLCAVLVVLVWSLPSRAQCTEPPTWRPPLKYFCSGEPARASEVNGNFGQLVAWLEAKVGQVDAGISLAPGSVTTSALASDAVTSAKIAPGTVDSTDLAPGTIGRDRLRDGGVAVYLVTNSQCGGAGSLSTSPTCTRQTTICGSGFCGTTSPVVVFATCNGGCNTFTPPCQQSSVACPETNTYVGSLVP